MPIILIDHHTGKKEYLGARPDAPFGSPVLQIRTSVESRNHSDTLDYTDYQMTKVTQALVYIGHHVELPRRFQWIDCTNLFTWRGVPERQPVVDELALLNEHILEDYTLWSQHMEAERQKELAKQKAHAEALRKIEQEKENNRPVLGKMMEVVRGRKVPIGTRGCVAYIKGDSVLLKAPEDYKNRNAQGRWVNAANLKGLV